MDEIEIQPLSRPLAATIRLPGSKSISNRALILAALADGRSTIESALFSDDTRYLISALRALGFTIETHERKQQIVVEGRGGTIPAKGADLFVGNAGTAMRFLAGFVTLGEGRFLIDGNRRMRERPIGALTDALRELGLRAVSLNNDRCPPIVIDAISGSFRGGAAAIDASLSSQFVSALLMPAPIWRDGLRLNIVDGAARPFIAMTVRMMERWGAHTEAEGHSVVISGGQRYRTQHFVVEPDASNASYFAAAAALLGGAVRLPGIGGDSVQGDTSFLRILEQMGAQVRWMEDGVEISGDRELAGVDADLSEMPDMTPTLAAIAPLCKSPTRIRNVGFIRHHESDRLAALATELTRIGVRVREFDDGLAITPSTPHAATIETYDDHRIAMAFAILGLKVHGIRIRNPDCVAKTYPDFFVDLASLPFGAKRLSS